MNNNPLKQENTRSPIHLIGLVLACVALFSVLPLAANGQFLLDQEDLVDLSSYLSVTTAAPGQTYRVVIVMDIADQWHINSTTPYQEFLIPTQFKIGPTGQFTFSEVLAPAGHDFSLAGEMMSVYDGRALAFFDLSLASDLARQDYRIPIELTYQACNDRECRPPQTVTTNLKVVVGMEGETYKPELFAFSSKSTPAKSISVLPEAEPTELERLIKEYGFWGYFMALGLAFVTGLLLSFSPCTYPMIPITVSIFAGQQRSIGKGFMLSLIYVGSMAFVYGLIGLVVSLVGGVFGAWLASPIVVGGIAIVFVVFALSMFGLFDLNLPAALRQKLGTAKTGGGVAGVIVLGIIAALVVSPCVGPFVAGILLYVATYGSPLFGFIVLFVFALGLGTLYLLIGTFSSAINALPNSGEWMETVKKFFGFVLLIMAIYFLRTILPETITAVLTGLLLVGFGVFGGGLDRLTAESAFFERLKKFLGILALLAGTYILLGSLLIQGFVLPPASDWLQVGSSQMSEREEPIAWQTELESGLADAVAQRKPVLIDTWATWCFNCKVLDRTVFSDPAIIAELKRFAPLKIQLEKASSDVTKQFMTRFGMKYYSLPTTFLLDSQGQVKKMFQGVMTSGELLAEMKKLN